ncbi:hypothetical protein LJK88_47305 [Paenibacillus sp. P26]|nr:hypothetical protein LJK88_47305 [Paenibacillus sp. P26]UUZ91821.1 hypothetical protein LJK87_41015 [Paenibacillus sp. P25]
MSIELPSLRERTEDIPELVQAFIREFSVQYQKPVPKVDPVVMAVLMNYVWPGNISELRNDIERMVILNDRETLTADCLPESLIAFAEASEEQEQRAGYESPERPGPAEEQAMIEEALRKTYGNKSAAAKLLGISRGTLYNKMKEYQLES